MKKFLSIAILLLFAIAAQAKIVLPTIIGDNMVLQRQSSVRLWGDATPDSKIVVTVSWSDKSYSALVDKDGGWSVEVTTPEASCNEQLIITEVRASSVDKVEINNIMIGEVWICSGQSNMEMPLRGFPGQPVDGSTEAIIESALYPNVRMFTVGTVSTPEPQRDCKSSGWLESSPESVGAFSAVGYFFARNITSLLDVPVGIINVSWGGSRIEAWLSEANIDAIEGIDHAYAKNDTRPNGLVGHLYNGMINPIKGFTAQGFLWYQGESNRNNPDDYDLIMAAMVESWRADWGNDAMPFYWTQIAPFKYNDPQDTAIAGFIEAQVRALDIIPHSGMVGTVDLGNADVIHPQRKREIGDRFAFMALRNVYNIKGLPRDAPIYKSMTIDGDKATLTFKNIGGAADCFRLYDNDGLIELRGFEMAGSDEVFYPAKCKLERPFTSLVVTCDQVKKPVAVRYAFKNVPDGNVSTVYGQPLVPFRTDKFTLK